MAPVEQPLAGPAPDSWRALLTGRDALRLGVLCLGVWLHAADSLMAATLVPSAIDEIGGAVWLNWTIALYQLASIVAGAATGLQVARYGLRRVMLVGALVHGIGCLLSALAPDMAVMLFGRLLQGAGGGALVAMSFVGINAMFPPALAPRAIGVASAVWGASAFLGPLIGGAFAELGYWRGGFWAFAAQAGLLVLTVRALPAIEAPAAGRPPLARLALFAAGLLAVATAGIAVSPVGSPLLCLAGGGLLWAFFRSDARAGADRLLPAAALDLRPPVGAGPILAIGGAFATVPLTVYGPILMRTLHGTGPLAAGYLIALDSIAWSFAAVLFAGALPSSERAIIRAGALLLAGSTAGFAVAVPWGTVAWVVPSLVMAGTGFGMMFGFVTRRVATSADPGDGERAASAVATLHMMGYALGAAASGVIANAAGFAEGIAVETARSAGFWLFAAFLPAGFVAIVAAWRLTRHG